MSGDGGSALLDHHDEAVRLHGLSFGGRAEGALADPIVQSVALVLLVSVLFSVLPAADIWFSGLFATAGAGFPLQKIAAFDGLARVGLIAVAAVLVAVVVAIIWKLLHPQRPAPLAPNAILFVLTSLAAVSWVTPIVLLAAESKRLPPAMTHPFGAHGEFIALWQQGGDCTTDCAAFSIATAWAVWLVGLATLAPPRWRSGALKGLIAVAALLALNAIGRGEAYLSGALLSAAVSGLLMAVIYRFTMEQPLPGLARDRLEDQLTRFGGRLRHSLGEADWNEIASKAQSPWRDRLGRWSPLKAVTFALVVLPGVWLLWLAATGDLTPLPWVFLIYNSGIWAIWFFLASLAVTPARHIFGWSDLIAVRRMLGIAGLAFTALHLADYLWLDRFSLGFIVNEYLTRPTIWVATLSTIGIFILGATSFDETIRRMGSAAWTRLHYIAYPAIGLAVLHFDMSPASLGGPPFLITGMFFWLMAWRVLDRYGNANDPAALLVLGLLTPLVSFGFEVAWLTLFQGLQAQKTVAFTFEIVAGLAPTWQLLILGLTVAALAAIFGRKSRSRARLRLRPPGSRPPLGPSVTRLVRAIQAPLQDRAGRYSALKMVTFGLLFVPGLWFAGLAATDGLTPQPFGFVIYNSGVWAMWMLLLSLAITPARQILRWSELIAVRRMIGLAGVAYTLFHVAIYFLLDRTTWASVAMDLQRVTIIVAIASTLALLALAVTSFDAAIRRLGSRNWNRIHNLAYPAIGLAILHFDMGPESLGGTPFVITGLYFWVMGWRGLNRWGRGTDPWALLGLTLASTALSFAFEAAWIRYYRGFTEFGTGEELWAIGLGLAATWQVLLVGLAVAALGTVFGRTRTTAGLTRLMKQRSLLPA